MQNLFLKSLVLVSVIGGGCFAVWRAHESLQVNSTSADPHEFKSLDSSDLGENGILDESGLIEGSATVNLDLDQVLPDQNVKPTLAPPNHEEASELVPTLAKPWNFESSPSDQKNDSDEKSDSVLPAKFVVDSDAKPLVDNPVTIASVTTTEKEAPTTLATNPVIPSSYFSASGNDVPHIEIPSGSNEVIQVGATERQDSNRGTITQAGFESAPGGNGEAGNTLLLPDQLEAENSAVLPPELPTQPENRFGPGSNGNDSLAPGLTKLPSSYSGPILLKPSDLQTLGQSTSRTNDDSGNSTIPLPVEMAAADAPSLPAPTPSGDLENPFSKFSVLPPSNEPGPTITTDDPVLPQIPGPNPFEKYSQKSVKTVEIEPENPSDAGFDTTPPMPSIPVVKEHPFTKKLDDSVLPREPIESLTDLPIPTELLPPIESAVLPSETVELPAATTPPALAVESFPLETKAAERVPPKMVEPEPLLPPPTQAPMDAHTLSDAPVLPPNLPSTGSALPKIRPSFDRTSPSANPKPAPESLIESVRPGMPIISPGRSRETQSSVEPSRPDFSAASSEVLPTPAPVVNREVPDSFPPQNPIERSRISTVANEAQAETESVLPFGSEDIPAPTLAKPAPAAITTIPNASLEPASPMPSRSFPEFPSKPIVPTPTDNETKDSRTAKAINELSGKTTIDPVVASGPQSPELKIEKIAPQQASIGDPLVYSIRIRNVGGSEARKVVVEDRIPRGTKLNGTIPQAVAVNDKLIWELGTLQPNEERLIKLQVVPMEAGEIGSVATVSFESAISATIRVTAPKLSVDIDGPTEALLGQNIPYKFTVRNNGDGDAKDVVLRALLPPSLKHPNGDDIEADLGLIPAGETKTVNLVVVADTVGVSTPKVLIWMSGKNYAENQADVRVLNSRIRLSRTGPKRRFVGRAGQFVTQVTNDSSAPLTNIKVEENIPVSLDLATFVNGWDPKRRVIEHVIPLLQPGETRHFTTQLIPNQAGELMSKLVAHDQAGNHVEVAAPLSVKGFADLEADVYGKNKVVAIGGQISLRLKLKNSGTASAKNVQAVFEIPQGLTFSTASGPSSYEVIGNQVIFDSLSEIPSDTEKTYDYDIVLIAAEKCTTKVKIKLSSADYSEPIHLEEPVRVVPDED